MKSEKVYTVTKKDVGELIEKLYTAQAVEIEKSADGYFSKIKKDGTKYTALYYVMAIDGERVFISEKLKHYLIENEILLQE